MFVHFLIPLFFLCLGLAAPATAAQKAPALTMELLQGAWHADSQLKQHPYYVFFLELGIKPDGRVDYAFIVPDELSRVLRYCEGQGTAVLDKEHATVTLEQSKCIYGDIFGQSRLECTAKDADALSCTGYISNTVQWKDNPVKRGDIWYQHYSHIPGARKDKSDGDAPR